MLPLLTAALSFAPQLMRWSGSDKAADVADKVASVVTAITGVSDPMQAVETIKQSPELQLQFNQSWISAEVELYKAQIQEAANARDMYKNTNKWTADAIAVLVVLSFIALVFYIVVFGIAEKGSEVIYTILGGLSLGFGTVLNFFFGSSSSSKTKDLINNLRNNSRG